MVALIDCMHCVPSPPFPAAAGGSLPPGKVVLAVRASGVEATAEALGEALADALWCAVPGAAASHDCTSVAGAALLLPVLRLLIKAWPVC